MDTKPTTSDRDIAYANKMLMSLAKTTSESSSQFSFRMLVGFAAILGALLANIESASAFLSKGTLWLLAILFSIVSLLNLI
jgi:fatty acid desaturase